MVKKKDKYSCKKGKLGLHSIELHFEKVTNKVL